MAAIQVNSVEYTKQLTVPIQMLGPTEMRGRIRVHVSRYTTVGSTFESGSTITGTPLPKGARLVGGYLAAEALANNTTLKVTINSVDVLAATNYNAAAITWLPDAAGAITGVFDDLDIGESSPIITSGTATAAAAKDIVLVLFYVVD